MIIFKEKQQQQKESTQPHRIPFNSWLNLEIYLGFVNLLSSKDTHIITHPIPFLDEQTKVTK